MSKEISKTTNPISYWQETILLIFLFFVSVIQVKDPLFLIGIIAFIFLIKHLKKEPFFLTKIDGCIIIIWLYNLILQFTTIYPVNSFSCLKTTTLSICAYFIVRTSLKEIQKIKILTLCLSITIGIICILAIVAFSLFADTIYNGGFTELYNFRFRYRPLGNIPNVWGTILIGFIGIIVLTMYLHRSSRIICFIAFACLLPVLFGIVVSFSRGVYVASIFLFLMFLIAIVKVKIIWPKKLGAILIFVTIILTMSYPFFNDILQTVKFNETISQKRSITSRVDGIHASQTILKEAPLMGVGCGNYSMAINELRYEDDNNDFTSFAPNGLVQLIIEQGILGATLWIILIIFIFKKGPYNLLTGIIFSTLIAILIRETTFPVFLENAGLQMLIFTTIAIYQNISNNSEHIFVVTPQWNNFLTIFITLTCVSFIIYSTIRNRNEKYNQESISALKSGKFAEAEILINKTGKQLPYLINRGVIYNKLFHQTNDPSYLLLAKYNLKLAIKENHRDKMPEHHLAIILEQEGKRDSALFILKNLANQFPNNALYHLSCFHILYKNRQLTEAMPHIRKAIKLSPSILDSSLWKKITETDTTTSIQIKKQLREDIIEEIENHSIDDPIILAKYGKILLSLDCHVLAKQTLQRAVHILPNLIYPWYYLGQIEMNNDKVVGMKYLKHFIVLNSHKYLSISEINCYIKSKEIYKKINKNNSNNKLYNSKFARWYKSMPIEFETFQQ